MQKKVISIFIALPLILGACAEGGMSNVGAPRATVDTYNDPNAYRLPQDEQECRQMAEQSTGGTLKSGAIGAGVGALIGAAGGAAIGAATGGGSGAATGAAVGAAAGGIGGGVQQGYSAHQDKNQVYKNCLRNRGHNVID